MKMIKIHKTYFMAIVYKTDFRNVNDIVAKRIIPWMKSKLLYTKITTKTKMVTPFNKSNYAVRNKPLKPNVLYVNQLTTYKSAIAKYVYKKRPSSESDKMKPHALRSAKR